MRTENATSMDLAFPLTMEPSLATSDLARIDRAGLENCRLQAIADTLPDAHYGAALALGATPGLSRRLAARCDDLEQLGRAAVAGVWPKAAHGHDLVIASDLLVGAAPVDAREFLNRLMETLNVGGHLVLVHWLDDGGADEAAALFVEIAERRLAPVSRHRSPHFRLDVLERV
jgi:hypothetical protein